ncbi:type II toxin-antitoxin system VapC family toxin [Spirulina sp.]|uniref:type II toxin-antitoxin system VapC family toxin n=1 Tax=Spirulina sp. TaxID=1157 RepID=UPI003F6F1619
MRQRIETTSITDIMVCSVVKAELYFGAMKSANPDRNYQLQRDFMSQFESLPFDDAAATVFGTIRATLEAAGTPIGAYDLQIASIALAHDLILVTHNLREFQRVDNLKLEDWEGG